MYLVGSLGECRVVFGEWIYKVDDCVLNLKCLIGRFIVGAHLRVVARETVGIVEE